MSDNKTIEEMEQEVDQNAKKMEDYASGKGSLEEEKPNPSTNDDNNKDDENSNEGDGTTPQQPTPQQPTPPQPTPVNPNKIGESSAYEEAPGEVDVYGNIKPQEKSTTKSDRPTPPDHGKPIKSGNEKNMMELFWNEFIVASYDFVINTGVDLTLDMFDLVLYGPKEGKENPKKEKINVFAIGDKVRETTREKMLEKKEVCNRAYSEIVQNLERDKNGEEVTWTILKREPKFFKELSEIYKKDPTTRTLEEKEKLYSFQKVPETMNRTIDVGIKTKELAIAAATCEVAADKENGDAISTLFTAELAKLEKALSSKNSADAKQCIDALEKEVEGKNDTFVAIRRELSTIKQCLRTSNYKDAEKSIDGIREISKEAIDDPQLYEIKIKQREKMYFASIEKERERIRSNDEPTVSKTFTQDVELLKETVSGSMPLSEKTQKVKELLEKMDAQLDATNPVQKKIKEAVKNANDTINDSTISSADAIEKIKEDANKIEDINTNENPNRHVVSKTFTVDVYDLTNTMKNPELTPAQKIAEITRITTSMDSQLSETNDVQKLMKDEVKKIRDTISATGPSDEEKLAAITDSATSIVNTHKENNPIIKKNKEFYQKIINSVLTTKEAIDTYTKAVLGRDEKKAKMILARQNMQVSFLGGSAGQDSQEPKPRKQEGFGSYALTQEILRNMERG